MTRSVSSSKLADLRRNEEASVVREDPSTSESCEILEDFYESAILRRGMHLSLPGLDSDHSSDTDVESSKNGNSIMGLLLQENIKKWCESTGRPATITIHFKGCTFQLHKFPLISRSGYLKRLLADGKEIRIPDDCPGNANTLEIVANFCYGSHIQMDSSNVAYLRCIAEYLQMGEEYGKGNLCERCDSYLNQVALQSWQDTILVLLHCQNLSPFAEDLGIVSQCVECLAFLACIEMVEPMEKASWPGTSVDSQFWSDVSVNTRDTRGSSPSDWWMDDLLRLPCGLFERVIAAIRREGMQEKYVSQVIVKFVDRWVFTRSCTDKVGGVCKDRISHSVCILPQKTNHDSLVQAVVRLLPEERDAVPISFLFSLLRCALACSSSADCRNQLESRIASQLELATITDFLYPFKMSEEGCISDTEVSCMRRIVNAFMSRQRCYSDSLEALPAMSGHEIPENFYCAYAVSAVAKVWDEYLAEVARDLTLPPGKFSELAEVVPPYARASHDHLYRAIHVYLKVHPHFSQEERQMVCGILNCQKLSPEMCTHAVQNELMPLRMIVQAMFMQQLQTRNVLSGHLQQSRQVTRLESMSRPLPTLANEASSRRNSMRSESFRSSRELLRSRHNSLGDDSFRGQEELDDAGVPLGYTVKRDAAFRQSAILKADYDATETRLQNLEYELAFMKSKIDSGKTPAGKCTSERFSSSRRRRQHDDLMAVPEMEDFSDLEDEDSNQVGDVKYSARTGNGVGFVTKVLRLVTLGGYRRRKGGELGLPTDEPGCSDSIWCGGRKMAMWRHTNPPSKADREPKVNVTRAQDAVLKNSSSCASQSAVKIRHKRRHSIS